MAKKKRGWGGRILRLLGWTLGLFVGLSLILVLVFRFVPVPVSALMVQRRVESWSSDKRYTSHHTWVPLEDISPSLGAAVIAAEDQNFTDHFGFDWQAIEKAIQHNEHSRPSRPAPRLRAADRPRRRRNRWRARGSNRPRR